MDVGIRGSIGRKTGAIRLNNLPEDPDRILDLLVSVIKSSPEDPYYPGLPVDTKPVKTRLAFDEKIASMSEEEIVEFLEYTSPPTRPHDPGRHRPPGPADHQPAGAARERHHHARPAHPLHRARPAPPRRPGARHIPQLRPAQAAPDHPGGDPWQLTSTSSSCSSSPKPRSRWATWPASATAKPSSPCPAAAPPAPVAKPRWGTGCISATAPSKARPRIYPLN